MNPHDAEHRAEDLVVVGRRAGSDVVEQRRVEEEALGPHVVTPIDDDRGAVRCGTIDVAAHLVAMLTGDQRAHLVVGLVARTDLDRRDPLGDLADELVGDRLGGEDDADRHAPLAGGAVAGRHRGVGGHVEIGVGEHEHVVLRPAEGLDALAVLRSRLVDVAGDRRRADEADGGDVGVLEEPVDGDFVAMHDVEASRWEAGRGEQLGEEHRRRRILLAGLEHERVAARQGVGEHPHRHHRRKVERGDPGDDAERLADRVDVDAGRRLLRVAALHQVRDAAGELDVLQAAGDLAEGVAQHLAVLGGEQAGDLLAVGVDELPEAEHHLGPA